MSDTVSRRLGALLFPGFELLDTFGPLEMFGNMPGAVDIVTVAERKGPVRSGQGPSAMADYGFDDCPPLDLLLIPGGMGTRTLFFHQAAVGLKGPVDDAGAWTRSDGTQILYRSILLPLSDDQQTVNFLLGAFSYRPVPAQPT